MNLSIHLKTEARKIGSLFIAFYVATVLLTSFLFLYSHHQDQIRLAKSYTRAAKDSIVSLDLRQAVISLSTSLQDGFKAIAVSDHRGTLRAGIPRDSVIENEIGLFDVRINVPVQLGSEDSNAENIAVLDFYYPIGAQLLFVLAFSFLFSIFVFFFFRRTIKKLEERHAVDLQRQEENLIAKMAMQVLHDIKSPLSVLTMSTSLFENAPAKEKELLNNAIKRISEIAGELLQKGSEVHSKKIEAAPSLSTSTFEISKSLENLTREKMKEFSSHPNIQIEAMIAPNVVYTGGLSEADLARIVSNLVNNSIKALPNGGKIKIALQEYKDSLAVQVADNGIGMTEDFIANLGRSAVTSGGGQGLGLSHAYKTIESAGGTLSIISQPSFGTIITAKLPKA